MKYYIEITLIPSADIAIHFIMEKAFQQIHMELVKMQNPAGKVPIGISFPAYDLGKIFLGNKIRLFSTKESVLQKMDAPKCLGSLSDYVHVTGIRMVPEKVLSYAGFARQQPKSSSIRMARRKAKREGIEFEHALKILDGYEEQRVKTPFINITSQSSNQRFKLFILRQDASELINDGFSCYGLSSNSTVPEF
jgi:CRISPR-associated endonuclease Csy4